MADAFSSNGAVATTGTSSRVFTEETVPCFCLGGFAEGLLRRIPESSELNRARLSRGLEGSGAVIRGVRTAKTVDATRTYSSIEQVVSVPCPCPSNLACRGRCSTTSGSRHP